MVDLDLCAGKLEGDKGNQRKTSLEIMTEMDPVEGGQKRETKGDTLDIMMEQKGGKRGETKGDKAGKHEGTASSRRGKRQYRSTTVAPSGMSMRAKPARKSQPRKKPATLADKRFGENKKKCGERGR